MPSPLVPGGHTFEAFVSQARQQLHEVWGVLGIDDTTQSTSVAELETAARQLFVDALVAQRSRQQAVEEDIQEQVNAYAAACTRLKSVPEPEYAPYFGSSWANRPLLEQQRRVTEARVKLEELVQRRQQELHQLHRRLYHLHSVIGIPLGRSQALRGVSEFQDFDNDLSPGRQAEYREEIRRLIDSKREADEEIIEGLWGEIHQLWHRLKISQLDTSRVVTTVSQINPNTGDADRDDELREQIIDHLQQHLKELKAEQQRVMDELVRETAGMLRALWEEYERKTGESLASELPTMGSESSVAVIEGLVLAMEERLQQWEEIRKVFDRRQSLLADEAEMLRAQRDPDRLLSKKQNMAQLLLKEEKTRNAIRRDLPKVEARLRQCCVEWEEQHHTPFMLEGLPALDLLGPGHPTERSVEKDRPQSRGAKGGRQTEGAVARTVTGPLPDRHHTTERQASPMGRARTHDFFSGPATVSQSPKRFGVPKRDVWATDVDPVKTRPPGSPRALSSPQTHTRALGRTPGEKHRSTSQGRPRASSLRR